MKHYKATNYQIAKIKRMNNAQLSHWIETFHMAAYNQGFEDATEVEQSKPNPLDYNHNVVIDDDNMYALLVSVKGISPRIAEEFLDKLYEWDEQGGSQEVAEGLLSQQMDISTVEE